MDDNFKWKKEYNDCLLSQEKKRKEANALLLKYKPKNLYKYLSLDYAIKNLKESVLTFQSPLNFNDPYDSLANMEFDKSQIDIVKDSIHNENLIFKELSGTEGFKYVDPNYVDNIAENFKEKTLKSFQKLSGGFRICCFSERSDSILMWSHYANYHKGICIEYDFDKLNEQYKNTMLKEIFDISIFNELYPIVYSEKFPIIKEKITKESVMKAFTTKYIDWKYECEWRMITNAFDDKESFVLKKVPKPVAIYMGCKIIDRDRIDLINICEEKRISLYQMNMNPYDFKLENTPIVLVINNEIFKSYKK